MTSDYGHDDAMESTNGDKSNEGIMAHYIERGKTDARFERSL